MFKKLNEKVDYLVIRLGMKKEAMEAGILNGNKDELHEMFGIGTTIAIAAVVFLIFLAAMKIFAPEAIGLVTKEFTEIIESGFKFTPEP